MNTIRTIVRLSFRGYRTNRGNNRRSTGNFKREIEMIQPHMPMEQFNEEMNDFEDIDEYASDFSNVGEFHKMHEREMEIKKSKLKTQIVKRQYFKSDEPAMLTWGEKEQIRLLYKEDPEEWTPDKLSESFPASREAILKILRSKWLPKSTKAIEMYEKNVKNNWDLLKAGKLAIDPQLQAHFDKFKNREIKITDPETTKKYIRPKPIFPKPQSVLFANVIQSYLDENRTKIETKNKEMATLTNGSESKITSGIKKIAKMTSREKRQETVTYDEFLKNHVKGMQEDKMTPIDRVIVDEYKARTAEDYKAESLVFESQSAVAPSKEFDKMMEKRKKETQEIAKIAPEVAKKKTDVSVIDENSLETGIIARHKKMESAQDDYPEFIKIPTGKYKPGVTYRVEDRYYDDDGVFLYRVPGLKT